jgi:hypothetical protein
MSKIVKIEVKNFKAIAEQSLNLNGCSAIIIGKNNSGKTSLLKGLCDRVQGLQPSIVLKRGENNGFVIMELTDGCKISWKFNDKSEQIVYTTSDGLEIKQGVIKYIQKKYFGESANFDIDKFIRDTPQDQRKTLLRLIGLNLDEIDNRYKLACAARTEAKNYLQTLKGNGVLQPDMVEKPEDPRSIIETIKNLNELELKARKVYDEEWEKILKEWSDNNEKMREKVYAHNQIQKWQQEILQSADETIQGIIKSYKILEKIGFDQFDNSSLIVFFNNLPKPKPLLEYHPLPYPEKPIYESKCEREISELKSKRDKILNVDIPAYNYYMKELERYNKYVSQVKIAEEKVKTSDDNVKKIEMEKADAIKASKMPEGFSFDDIGLLYNGFPLNKQSQSSSSMYIAGIKLATMNLGELKAIHFDASFLDKKSIEQVQEYADKLGLQLLIERVSYDAEEISYQIIERRD